MAQPPLDASGSADEPAGAADDLLSEESEGLADESGSELRSTQIGAGQHAARLDKALADLVPEFSRSYLQQLLERVEQNEILTGKDAKYFNARTARHAELMTLLGLDQDDEDESESDLDPLSKLEQTDWRKDLLGE